MKELMYCMSSIGISYVTEVANWHFFYTTLFKKTMRKFYDAGRTILCKCLRHERNIYINSPISIK